MDGVVQNEWTAAKNVTDYAENVVEYAGNVTNTDDDNLKDLLTKPDFRLAVIVRAVGGTSIVLFASIGNPIALIVLRSKRLRDSATSLILSYLAVVDLLAVFFGLVPQSIAIITDNFIALTSDFACKFFWFAPGFLMCLSAWLLVLVSFERVVAVWWPTKLKVLFSKKTAICYLVVLTGIHCVINARYFFCRKLISGACKPDPRFYTFERTVSVWIGRMLYWGVPLATMFVNNTLIFLKIRLLRDGQKCFKNKTILVMTNTFAYTACSSPLMIFNMTYHGWYNGGRYEMVERELEHSALKILAFVNHAINLVLYCAAGKRFREEFMVVIMRRARKVHPYPETILCKPRPGATELCRLDSI